MAVRVAADAVGEPGTLLARRGERLVSGAVEIATPVVLAQEPADHFRLEPPARWLSAQRAAAATPPKVKRWTPSTPSVGSRRAASAKSARSASG
jgi:hypothetical protein